MMQIESATCRKFNKIIMSEESLKNKTIKGVGWSAFDNIIKMGITFIVSIVLARKLSPDEYGLIGILTIFITIFNTIVDSGFTSALIRKRDVTDEDYCTVFFTNLVVSVCLAICLYFLAKPISLFFERSELINLTRVMSIIVVINALSIVQKARTTKYIDFKSQAKITLISGIIGGTIGIIMAYCEFGVWALVGQQFSVQLVTSILFATFNRWMPKLKFSWTSFKEMWSFSWKLLIASLVDSFFNEVYQVVIGKCYSPQSLGLFTRAKQFRDLFSSNLTTVVQRVSYPVLSTIQDEQCRLKAAYQKIIKTTMYPTMLIMIGMASVSKSMVTFLLGEKWIDCVPFLQIICLYGILYPLHAINLNMLQVKGRSDLFLRLEIIKNIIAVLPIVIGIFTNIYAMLWSTVFTQILSYYINAYYSKPLIDYGFIDQIKDIAPLFLTSVAIGLPIYIMNYLPFSSFIIFPLQLIVGIGLVITCGEITRNTEYIEIKNIVFNVFNNNR